MDFDKAAQIVHLLCEGVGVRAAGRLADVDEHTVLNILQSAGEHCAQLLDRKIRNVKAEYVEVDELWSFIRCKNVNAQEFTDDGDQYTFLATDSITKLILSHIVGKRTQENAYWFLRDLEGRVDGRFQLSSDGFNGYTGVGRKPGAVKKVFGDNIDYATEIKEFGHNAEGQRRYSAPPLTDIRRRKRIGKSDSNMITTTHAERCNLSMRLFSRRFTRLTLGYSKTLENHRHAVALFVAHFNFCREHSALEGLTPACAAELTDHTWTVRELLAK